MRPPIVILVWCLWTAGCAQPVDRVDPGRDVIVVVIDTLRADFVGVSGRAPHAATPRIDALARRGRWFDRAWSSAPWTPPSVMTLMTSLSPAVHGLDREAERLAEAVPPLPDGATTLAEVFRRAGYRTMAVTAGGGVGSVYGFDRGFERWFEPDDRPESDVEAGVDRALAWLSEPDPRPTFLFFHTYEVHLPNTHPPLPSGNDPAELAAAAYAGDLAVADRHLGRLFEALDRAGRLDRSVVVVTADHGENLHDRVLGGRPVDHGHHLHTELLRVPLIWVAPGLIPADGGVAEPARLLDVLPTLCSLVGIDLDGVPHQGRDLRPVLQGWGSMAPLGEVFASAPMQGPTWGAVRTPEWTYLRSPAVDTDQWWGRVELPPRALYRRSDDPAERTDVEADHPAVSAELERVLSARQTADRELRRRLGGPEAVERDSTEALRALGYLDREPDDGESTE
ncbi:MAG: sulfatase [Candidatus Sulfomarinibacteraceae bacterium]